MRYEEKSPETMSETMALKAVVEPMLIRARRELITAVTAMDQRGMPKRLSTYNSFVSKIPWFQH